MRTDSRFSNIEHQFDPTHIAKGLLKKIMKAASKKGNHGLTILLELLLQNSIT